MSPPVSSRCPDVNEHFDINRVLRQLHAIMTIFRPCIDLHAGSVKQIVGGTLSDTPDALKTNHVSTLPAGHFAQLYKDNGLTGAHVIMLGPGNEDAAREAVATWKNGLQVGGGITEKNAAQWIEWGAQKVGGTLPPVKKCISVDRRTLGNHNILPLPGWKILFRAFTGRPHGARQRQGEASHRP